MSKPQNPKSWKAEYARSGKSRCRTCNTTIDYKKLRLGKMVQSSIHDGFITNWNHADCILKEANQIKSIDDVEAIDTLRWEDQEMIRKYIESAPKSKVIKETECCIQVSQTSRAACKHCGQKIIKGEVRISTKPDGEHAKGFLAWHHVKCLMELSPSIQVEKLSGWNSLSSSDQSAVSDLAKKAHPMDMEVARCRKQTNAVDASAIAVAGDAPTSKGGLKRPHNADDKQDSIKVAKVDGDAHVSSGRATPMENIDDELGEACDLETKLLEAQSREFWALKDECENHVTKAELREMLEANDQDSRGPEHDLLDCCVDGMMFGALGQCPICSGSLRYSGGTYRCIGFMSEWTQCPYSTSEPKRADGKWKIPEKTNSQFLKKWFESQKEKKPVRILHLPSSSCESLLKDLKVAIAGLPKESIEEWKRKIVGNGGICCEKVTKDTSCLVVSEALNDEGDIREARKMKIPIVREGYLADCIKGNKKLPFYMYKVEMKKREVSSSMVPVRHNAVHEASGLQDSGHILKEGESVYNISMSLYDVGINANRYYILQIIQEDQGKDRCYLFRKWGRTGNDKIGKKDIKEMPQADAISKFKQLFLKHTGHCWEAWDPKTSQKKNGKYFPLDIDYGVHPIINENGADSKLPHPLIELLKMLFNVEIYRAAMVEFEIDMSKMPLGKLSKSNIEKGFEALTDIQKLLQTSNPDPLVRDSLLMNASNKFFTLIPSIRPYTITDEGDLKSKVKMLESLQNIEIASKLVGYEVSIDDNYKNLHCVISPLAHDSEDFRLAEKFLQTTQSRTHPDWRLELEEVFSLEREGEFDKFAPYRDKIGNRMLLWHGSRLTNFVGILKEGLRIAPPTAPVNGYMFGKGVYFADLVHMSAQYCYTDEKNPIGLMLLSEVALGNIYEVLKEEYMDKAPEGKHSTKALGEEKPQESKYEKWRGDVTVPCGKPEPSNVHVEPSVLKCNEYIVYNTSQVKMHFLLKVRFHHKK